MTMKKVDEGSLAQYVLRLLNSGDFRRLIGQRFFRGAVGAVQQLSVGGPYAVQVIRTGESVVDGDWYQCLPGFGPMVGMQVELMWRDKANALVLGPMLGPSYPYAHVYQAAAQSIGNDAAVVIGYDTIEANGDPFNLISGLGTTGFAFTCPIPGRYRVEAAFSLNDTVAGTNLFCGLMKNGVNNRKAMDVSFPIHEGSPGGAIATTVRVVAGDTLAPYAWQTTTAARNTRAQIPENWAVFSWIGP